MFESIVFVQFVVILFFLIFERIAPARDLPRAPNFYKWLFLVNSFSGVWFGTILYMWANLEVNNFLCENYLVTGGFIFYVIYSFFGYWWHRARHSVKPLWFFIHKFHHSPPRMETTVAFFKHPFEFMANSIVIFFLGWVISAPAEWIALALAIEGVLETYHHSNIRTHKRLRFIGYVFQTPEMHLVHHQRGLHKYNYASFLWDSIFGTILIPDNWNGQQGFASGDKILDQFTLKSS